MKSRILIIFIIVLVFIMTIALYIKDSIYMHKLNNSQTELNNYTHFDATIAPIAQEKFIYTPTAAPTPKPTPTLSPTPMPTYDPDFLFIDNFNDDSINECFWNIVEREKNYNKELQSYVKNNAYTENGCLVLRADEYEGKYKSGLVNTKDKIEFLYGTVEVKLKYPSGKSFFPAIWMLPADNTRYPEIDIMEVVGHKPKTVFFVYHYHTKYKQRSYTYTYLDDYDDFHTYKLQWTPEGLTWYVDNRQVHHTTDCIPDKPMYLIINFAIGGSWPGSPDANTVFPSEVIVDYVKISPYKSKTRREVHDNY